MGRRAETTLQNVCSMSILHDGIDAERFEIRVVESFDLACKACGAEPDGFLLYYGATWWADKHLRECKGAPE